MKVSFQCKFVLYCIDLRAVFNSVVKQKPNKLLSNQSTRPNLNPYLLTFNTNVKLTQNQPNVIFSLLSSIKGIARSKLQCLTCSLTKHQLFNGLIIFFVNRCIHLTNYYPVDCDLSSRQHYPPSQLPRPVFYIKNYAVAIIKTSIPQLLCWLKKMPTSK